MPRFLIPVESARGETRVAATPETIKKFKSLGCSIAVERGAGLNAGFLDESYEAAGADLINPMDGHSWSMADVLLCVQAPKPESLKMLKAGALLTG